ncbi:MAG: hypothetical protein D3919_05670 [Candidatus Electrothrix sp. AW5]|nr:hypothetical protein [Candidatus Electrothrix gigas]
MSKIFHCAIFILKKNYALNRYLKIAGAWWTPENARIMLALRVDRADGYWETYWDNIKRAA